jgi:hypothetical protein
MQGSIIDARKYNENIIKDVTLFPDQDAICHDSGQSFILNSICLMPMNRFTSRNNVLKIAFVTICSTFMSCVIEMHPQPFKGL